MIISVQRWELRSESSSDNSLYRVCSRLECITINMIFEKLIEDHEVLKDPKNEEFIESIKSLMKSIQYRDKYSKVNMEFFEVDDPYSPISLYSSEGNLRWGYGRNQEDYHDKYNPINCKIREFLNDTCEMLGITNAPDLYNDLY